MVRNEGDRLRTVVVCTPGEQYFGVQDLEAHHMNEASDPERTVAQHVAMTEVMEGFGARVVTVRELLAHPNSTFTRDAALVTPRGNLRLRMGLPARRGEPEWLAGILEDLGTPTVGSIEAPGTAEGGDVILAGDVAFAGRSSRTNEEGIRQLSALLEPMGYHVRVARVPDEYLHIGGAMSVIAPRAVLACAGVFPPGFFEGFHLVEVPRGHEAAGANVICLQEGEVLASAADGGAVIDRLEAEGIRVHALDLSEFRKGAGGPTCMILPVERAPAGEGQLT